MKKFKIPKGTKCFSSGFFQNYLAYKPAKKTTGKDVWKSDGMSEENIKSTKSKSNFSPTFADHHVLPDNNFNGLFNRCLHP